jgi:hypothetical protein
VIPAHSASMFEDLNAVVHDVADTCAGEHARTFLGAWQGKLLYDDYTGNVAVEDMLRLGEKRPVSHVHGDAGSHI